MEIHAVGSRINELMIEQLKTQHQKPEPVKAYADPHREYLNTLELTGTIRQWLTLPVEERKRIVKEDFRFIPQQDNEPDQQFEIRLLKRRRDLQVIIQEEARAKPGVRSPEVALGALKQLFYDHDFSAKK